MAYTEKQKTEIINKICQEITDGLSFRKACEKHNVRQHTFLTWIGKDKDKAEQYARAMEARADKLFEEIIEIADKQSEDVIQTENGVIVNHNVINRNRLQVEARKWALSKMMPKKYGDKIDVTSDNDKIQQSVIILPSNDRD